MIWADVQRSAPLGYVAKGKVVTVGEVPRNKNQVVPIAVSGRVGYIAMEDLSFEDNVKTSPEERRYERFKDVATKRHGDQIVMSVTGFNATESKDSTAGRIGENWNFIGGSLKGEAPTATPRVAVIFIGDYLYAENRPETFRVFQLSLGVSFLVLDTRYLKLKVEAAGTAVPYVQYESDPLFTLNGYGLGGLAQGVLDLYFGDNWGLEVSAGLQAIKLYGIDRPEPFKDFSPLFTGTRWSGGILYRF